MSEGRSEKSNDAFRTIGEVSEELDIPQHVLRFWETKFAQIKPMKRGGGRRYYRPDDINLLRRVRDLLYSEGYTIRGVQKLIKEQGVKGLIAGDDQDVISNENMPIASAAVEEPLASASPAVENDGAAGPAREGVLSADQRSALVELREELTRLRDRVSE